MTTLVLLIDSDIAFMVNIKKALEDTGEFRVNLATNTAAAVETLRQGIHDVAIVDFEAPDRDIMELLQLLRNTQPSLPVILAPRNDMQHERAQFLDVQGVIARPYTARSLMPYIREITGNPRPQAHITPPDRMMPRADDFAEPEIPPALRDLFPDEKPDPAFDEDERRQLRRQLEYLASDSPDSVLAEFEALEQAQTGPLDGHAEPPATRILDERATPSPTRALGDTDEPPETQALDDETLVLQTRRLKDTEPLDTHPLPSPQLPGTHDTAEFDEVLDAMAQTPPEDLAASPDQRAFHDLVDSMRPPQTPAPRRTWLDELLTSMAANADQDVPSGSAEGALDYVLESIRHTPSEPGAANVDDTTIGELIEGLFEPSFEGVLAALSGQPVDEAGYQEPTYAPRAAEGLEPREEDRLSLDDMSAEDRPAWLAAYETEGIAPPPSLPEPPPQIAEPPITGEDSSKYPATTALSATSSDAFSLDDLLTEIETHLPPARRPRLKPLPSWGIEALTPGPSDLGTLFDRAEGLTRPPAPSPAELAEALADYEPPVFTQDTRPSAVLTAEMEAGTIQERDTEPYRPVVPDETGAPPAEVWEDAASEPGDAIPVLSMNDLLALAELPPDAGTEEIQRELARRGAPSGESEAEIAEVFYEGVRGEHPASHVEPPVPAGPPPFIDETPVEPDDSHLIPVPLEGAARLIEGDLSVVEEEAEIAQAAVRLTQFALESSAQATLLSREGRLLASAGDLPEAAIHSLFKVVDETWQTKTGSDSLIRFVTLPDVGEFLLYSVVVENGLALSMIFSADTPVRAIRRQARRLSESLALVPEPPAAQTLPSRPTDLQPPAGLRAAIADQDLVPEDARAPVRPVHTEAAGPYTGYTCLWLLHDPGQELPGEIAPELSAWIQAIAREQQWSIDTLDIRPDYVLMSLNVPQKLPPDDAIMRLMTETARLSAEQYPDWIGDQPLWADGYYLTAPPRPLTEREIARFMTYQRQ
jgi:DNA-binding response OmpR family regulator/REP element-mobilizing transposase RayT